MNPTVISASLFILQEAVKTTPSILAAIRELANKDNPTDTDWDNLRKRVASKSYEDFVPHTSLKKEQ